MTDYDTAEDLYRAQGEENDQAAIDDRVETEPETEEEYAERVLNVPGVFGEVDAKSLLTGDHEGSYWAGGEPPQPDPEAAAVLNPDAERDQFYSAYPELYEESKANPAEEQPVAPDPEPESDEDYEARLTAVTAANDFHTPLAPGGEGAADVAPTGAAPEDVVQAPLDTAAPTEAVDEPSAQQPDVEPSEEDTVAETPADSESDEVTDAQTEVPVEETPAEPEDAPAQPEPEEETQDSDEDKIAAIEASDNLDDLNVTANDDDNSAEVKAAAAARIEELESNV